MIATTTRAVGSRRKRKPQAEEEDLQDMDVGKAQQQQQQQRRLDSVTDDKSDGDQIHAASSSGHAPPGAFYHLGAAFLRAACSALGLPPKNANTHGCSKLLSAEGFSPQEAEDAGQRRMAARPHGASCRSRALHQALRTQRRSKGAAAGLVRQQQPQGGLRKQ